MTGDDIVDTGCTLKAYRRECVERLELYNGMHRFLPTLLKMRGYRVTQVPVGHHPRRAGKTKYDTWRRLKKGLADVWAVRWMKKNWIAYEGVLEVVEAPATMQPQEDRRLVKSDDRLIGRSGDYPKRPDHSITGSSDHPIALTPTESPHNPNNSRSLAGLAAFRRGRAVFRRPGTAAPARARRGPQRGSGARDAGLRRLDHAALQQLRLPRQARRLLLDGSGLTQDLWSFRRRRAPAVRADGAWRPCCWCGSWRAACSGIPRGCGRG